MGLSTTTVGWFPKPVELRRARWQFAEGEIDEGALRAVEDRATRAALELQAEVGLDLLVDGQMDRSDAATFFAERLEGMEVGGLVRCYGNRYYRKPVIVGDVGRDGAVTVERWKQAQGLAQAPVKAILTGPYTLMDWSFDEHYGSRERCCMALAEVIAAEAEDLAAAGAAEIEIDEPAVSVRPEEMDLAAEALGRVTRPLAGKARTWTHICYGELVPVMQQVLALPVDGLLLGMVHSGYELLDALEGLPEGKLLGAGVLDVHSAEVETADVVRERAERLLRKVPAGRLRLIPDAGLRTLGQETAKAKLRAMVEAAAALS